MVDRRRAIGSVARGASLAVFPCLRSSGVRIFGPLRICAHPLNLLGASRARDSDALLSLGADLKSLWRMRKAHRARSAATCGLIGHSR